MDELQQAQSSLGRALARSRAGEDKVLAGQVREKGEQFANLLNGLIRMGRVHAADNRAFDQPANDLKATLDALVRLLGSVQLVTVEDQVYINDIRIKMAAGKQNKHLGSELTPHNVGGITFHGDLTVPQLRRIVALLSGRPAAGHPRTALLRVMREEQIVSIELFGIFRFRMSEDEVSAGDPTDLVRRLVQQVEDTWDNLAVGRQGNVLALRRLVVELAQAGAASEPLWLVELPHASAHGWHAFKVTQLALILTEAAGLPDGLQQDLGVAALTHDVGYAAPEGTVPGFEAHGFAGARALLRQLGFHEAKIRRAFGAMYHHADLKKGDLRTPLVARVLRLAEDYDGMIRRGGGRMTPPEALSQLAAGANTHYDPVLVQLLINRLGAYPPGTFLGLDDGRVVKSISCVRSPESFAQPRAVVVRQANGQPPTHAEFVDLALEGKVRGALKPKEPSPAHT